MTDDTKNDDTPPTDQVADDETTEALDHEPQPTREAPATSRTERAAEAKRRPSPTRTR